MNYKIIFYIGTLAIISAIIGGGAVYVFTNNKNINSKTETSTSNITEPNSSSVKTFANSTIEQKISSISSLTIPSTLSPKSAIAELDENLEKPAGQKFVGWLGSTNIEMYLNFKQDKITGKYYNSFDKKWYTLDGVFRDYNMGQQTGQMGTIELNEFNNNLITGSLSFNLQNPAKYTNQNQQNNLYQNNYSYSYGIPAGVYYTNSIKTMAGNYSDKKNANYDLFVSYEPADIADFVDKSIEVKVVKLDDGNIGNATIFEQNGNYFFTFEDWKVKDFKVGDKIKITGKIRSFINSQSFETKPFVDPNNQGQYESTSQGIFQISDVKKV